MKIQYLTSKNSNCGTVVAVGKFDGIHTGHVKLIKRAVRIAHKNNLFCVVYTVEPKVYSNRITDDDYRIRLLKKLGVDAVCTDKLTERYASQMPYDFVKNVLCGKLNAKYVTAGYNFKFGHNRCGNTDTLKKICGDFGIEAEIIDCVYKGKNNIAVSSTYIKELISNGNMSEVNIFLGRNYSLCAQVRHGKQLGRTIGFPTINMYFPEYMIKPKEGVYCSVVHIDGKKYKGITNIGHNPTVTDFGTIKAETHIIDYNDNAYGKNAVIEFLQYIRPEKKFASLEALKMQLQQDVRYALNTEADL